MRRKLAATLVLLAAAAGAVFMAFRSYGGIDSKLSLATSSQETMQAAEEETGQADDSAEASLQDSAQGGADQDSPDQESPVQQNHDTSAPEDAEEPEVSEEPEEVNPEAPVLTLKSSRVEITAGDSFNALAQVEEITDDSDDRYRLFRNISIYGDYDAETVGEYTLEYTVTDKDGNQSVPKKLTLVVKEKPE